MYKSRTYGTLKQAVASLIEANDGLAKAESLCQVSDNQLFKYSDESGKNANIHIRGDVVADLEKACGRPFVTEWLAFQTNHVLLPQIVSEEEKELALDMAAIGAGSSALFKEFFKALANDGIVDSNEAQRLMKEGDCMLRAYLNLRGQLIQRVESLKEGKAGSLGTPAA